MFSPFFNYDMYSYTTLPHRQYEVIQIRVDGKLLQPKDFSPHEWDNLVQPIVFFDKQKEWNNLIFHTEVKRFLGAKDADLYINTVTEKTFTGWYQQHVLRIAGRSGKHGTVTVSRDTFLLAQQYLYKK